MAGRALTDDGWHALMARAEGPGFYAVITTGIVCRTGCAARTPLRRNVLSFDALEDALSEGFRRCKRCKP